MARLIYQKDSTAQHLRMGRRHIRLCGRMAGAGKWVAPIQQKLDLLTEKHQVRLNAAAAAEDAYDDLILCDAALDNGVRTLFERLKQYDRDNNARTLETVFPAHGYSDIVRMPLSEEPQEVDRLLLRLESLGAEHELLQQAEPLRQRKNASSAAWDAYRQATGLEKEAAVAEQLAKIEVRRQYEFNYLDARREFGASAAEALFPKVSSGGGGTARDASAPTPAATEESIDGE
jgi:hypothetical protein